MLLLNMAHYMSEEEQRYDHVMTILWPCYDDMDRFWNYFVTTGPTKK